MIRKDPVRFFAVLAAGALTVLGTLYYGYLNYQSQQLNPFILSWMDPRLHVEEVTSEPSYRSLVDAINATYRPSKIKIWEVEHDYGFMRGSKTELMVSVLSQQIEQPLNLRTHYPSRDVLNALWKKANQMDPEKAKLFRKSSATVAAVLQDLAFDSRYLCVTTPPRLLSLKLAQEPEQPLKLWSYSTAGLFWVPPEIELKNTPVTDSNTHTVFFPPRVEFVRHENRPLDSFSDPRWVSLPLEQGTMGCNLGLNRWPDQP